MRAFIAILLLCLSSLSFSTSLSNLVIFGDSLSDNGNLYEFMHHQLPQSPPYYHGRFSNGPIWVDKLAQSYFPNHADLHIHDYAFGGAGVLNDLSDDDDVFFTLKREIDTYLLAHQDMVDAHSMFFIWIGGNNYLGLPEDKEKIVNDVIRGTKISIERLIQKGARYITVGNLPDLGKTPLATTALGEEAAFSMISRYHNQRLYALYQQLQKQYPEVHWVYFDIQHFMDDIFLHPENYPFKNLKDTCYDSLIKPTSPKNLLHMTAHLHVLSTTTDESLPSNCQGYLFFDLIHPTAQAHAIAAELLQALFREADITFEDQA